MESPKLNHLSDLPNTDYGPDGFARGIKPELSLVDDTWLSKRSIRKKMTNEFVQHSRCNESSLSFLEGFSLDTGENLNQSTAAKQTNLDKNRPREICATAKANEREQFLSKAENRQSASIANLWNSDSRILQIGDFHQFGEVKSWTKEKFNELANNGATAFAMEFLPRNSQQSLDRYAEARAEGREIQPLRSELYSQMAALQRTDKEASLPENSQKEALLKKQFELVDRAIDAGLRPLALEPQFDSSQDLDSKFQDLRNKSWTQAVGDYLKAEPRSRVVMFAGAAHFGFGKLPTSLGQFETTSETLTAEGFKPTVLQFAGGDYKRGDSEDPEYHELQVKFFQGHPEFKVDSHSKALPPLPDAGEFAATVWTETYLKLRTITATHFAIKVSGENRQADRIVFLPKETE